MAKKGYSKQGTGDDDIDNISSLLVREHRVDYASLYDRSVFNQSVSPSTLSSVLFSFYLFTIWEILQHFAIQQDDAGTLCIATHNSCNPEDSIYFIIIQNCQESNFNTFSFNKNYFFFLSNLIILQVFWISLQILKTKQIEIRELPADFRENNIHFIMFTDVIYKESKTFMLRNN